MDIRYVNIHTHHPAGNGTELRTAGIHPWLAERETIDSLPDPGPQVQALGETGLDYAVAVDRQAQERLFRSHLALAERLRLPVVLHCVRAFEPMMDILARYDLRAAIFHGFIGSPQQALRAVARGYMLSFGERTFASPRTMEALRRIPLDHLFAETDESDLPIAWIYARIAETREITIERLAEAVAHNYERIFGEI